MAGGDDPKSSAREEDDDEDQFYDPYSDFGQFTEEHLMNVMSDSNPNLMDFDIDFSSDYQNPPPSPLVPHGDSSNMEISETRLMEELSLNINSGNTDFESFENDLFLSWEMFESPNDVSNINNVRGEAGGSNNGNEQKNSEVFGNLQMSVFEGNGSNFVGENGRLEVSTRVFGENPSHFEIGGPSSRPVSVTPPLHDGIVLCNCCQPLRGLVHTNGREVTRLDIYGETGSFCHAVLETQPFSDSNKVEHQCFDLKNMDMVDVRRFLENYLLDREATGFTLMHDTNASLSSFYQAVNAGLNNNQPPILPMPPPNGVSLSLARPNEALRAPSVPLYIGLRNESPGTSSKVRPRRNTPLAAQDEKQRERTGNMTLADVEEHFHLPIEKAAQKMEVCPTVLKKICRRGGLLRWPYRKIKSYERRIEALRKDICKTESPEVRAAAELEIVFLIEQINEIRNEAIQNSRKP